MCREVRGAAGLDVDMEDANKVVSALADKSLDEVRSSSTTN
ncbi:unnamed protein product [Gongylonema pulchrum]|uniref:DUF768 domain-containing protein n=1 Tax=Gongylonema pulchrum TaxID=637853 RepID=A0A183F0S7_9BILA|nr:unnamed protein product [Gongylonema pulchrum]